MKHLIIGVLILWAFLALASLIWTSRGQPPGATLTRLLEPPQQRLASPYENGYFYLLGFAAAASLDPAKVGQDIWLETTAAPSARNFNYDMPGRSELQIQLPMEQVLSSWSSESPESDFRTLRAQVQTLTGRDRILLTRYERWLAMPFEDMGFGHQATPRFVEIFVGHRLYVADGFSRQTALGMQRLKQDIHIWRRVLRDTTTITTKVMAQIVITDNLRLLSTLLSQPAVNKTVMAMIPDMAPPLTAEESSLRWPLQHQFTLGVHGKHPGERTTDGQTESLDTHTVVDHRRQSSQTGFSPDHASSRALIPWSPTTDTRNLGQVRTVLRCNDPCDGVGAERLTGTSLTRRYHAPRHRGEPHQSQPI